MSHPEPTDREPADEAKTAEERRTFLSAASTAAMAFGLTGGYGMFGALATRYLYPAHPPEKRWMFVSDLKSLPRGASLNYVAPTGHRISITRLEDKGTVEDFIALSSVCPHLGCQVHWETQNSRFFCPCHNGAFDKQGVATAGPPADARQTLARYPLRIENGLLYIEVSMTA